MNCVIVRYDEIGIKSRIIRHRFENQLVTNIKKCIGTDFKIKKFGPRFIIFNSDLNIAKKVSKIFGVNSTSIAVEIKQDIESIKKTALSYYKKGSFRITTQRVNKKFKLTSMELNMLVGAYIVKKKNAKVDLKNYDINIHIELFNKKAYIFDKVIKGFGGLPVGSQAKVLSVLDNKISVLATLLIMNRGCVPVITGSKKYFNELKKLVCGVDLEYRKKFDTHNCLAIISSKTIKDIKTFKQDKEKYDLPIFYPMLTLNKKEITKRYSVC